MSNVHRRADGSSSRAEPGARRHRGLLSFLTLLGLLILAVVVFAFAVHIAPTAHANGACTGIGFGCTPSPRDGLLIVGMLIGLPTLAATAVIGALLNDGNSTRAVIGAPHSTRRLAQPALTPHESVMIEARSSEPQNKRRAVCVSETRLYLSDDVHSSSSRVGGIAPALDYEPGYLDRFRYLCTIGHTHIPTVDGQDISVFVRNGFLISDGDTRFPNIGIDCVMHPPAQPRNDSQGRLVDIGEAGLSEAGEARDPEYAVIRIAATPQLIQNDPSYAAALVEAGYSFIFEFDEEGYDSDFMNGSYPFNYGALYVYGKRNAAGLVSAVAAGYVQFS